MPVHTATKVQHKIAALEKRAQLLSHFNADDEASLENLLLLKIKYQRTIEYYYDVAIVLSGK